jgi:heme A synthase
MTTPTTTTVERSALFSGLVGLTSLGILLQGVWAGVFIRPGQPFDRTWVTVHARSGEITIVLALAAAVVAFWKLRFRRDLVVGSAVLVVLLALEAYLGGEILEHQGMTVVHVPLALALMALAVWLPFQSRRTRPRAD